jgi:hypothetical protein
MKEATLRKTWRYLGAYGSCNCEHNPVNQMVCDAYEMLNPSDTRCAFSHAMCLCSFPEKKIPRKGTRKSAGFRKREEQ